MCVCVCGHTHVHPCACKETCVLYMFFHIGYMSALLHVCAGGRRIDGFVRDLLLGSY